MIRKTDIVAVMAVGLMAGGCTQTDDVQPGESVPIRLTATVDGDRADGSRTATRSGSTTSTTQDTELLEGQTVDAYIQEKGGDWLAQPVACTVDGDEGALTYSGDIYYPMDATPVEIYAVHPSYTSAATFTVSSDQTDDDNYAVSDLCYSKTAEYGRSESAQTLVFSHVLSKIVVNVDMSALGGSHTVSNLRLKAKTQTTMTYPADNANGYTLGTAATPASIAMNEGGAVVIPPQTTAAEGDVRITFDVSGIGPIVYEFPASTEFASNTQYTYTVKVGNTVTVTSTITAWGSQVNKSKTVEIGRPKLPIEYVGEHNMATASTMAADDNAESSGYFYWGATPTAMSSTMLSFNRGIEINNQKYHLPSVQEMMAIFPPYATPSSPQVTIDDQIDVDGEDGERVHFGNGLNENKGETLAWGVTNNNGTYLYDVYQRFYNDYYSPEIENNKYIAYGLRYKDTNGKNSKYTCAFRYEFVIPDVESPLGHYFTIKYKYVGSDQNVTISMISDEIWWSSYEGELFFSSGGYGNSLDLTDYGPGFYSSAVVKGSGCYWTATGLKSGNNSYCLIFHGGGTYGNWVYPCTWKMNVRLFKDAE